MVVFCVALLFLVLTSSSLAATAALFVSAPIVPGAVAWIVTVALAPSTSVPMLHVTFLAVIVQVPWLADAVTLATPAGNVSVNWTPVAVAWPLFVTVSVYVIGVP